MLSYRFIIFAQQLGTGEKLLILVEGDDGLRKLSEIEFKKRSHCVHIGVAAENTHRGRLKSRLYTKTLRNCLVWLGLALL